MWGLIFKTQKRGNIVVHKFLISMLTTFIPASLYSSDIKIPGSRSVNVPYAAVKLPRESCVDFTGRWDGVCVTTFESGKTESNEDTLDIYQVECSEITLNANQEHTIGAVKNISNSSSIKTELSVLELDWNKEKNALEETVAYSFKRFDFPMSGKAKIDGAYFLEGDKKLRHKYSLSFQGRNQDDIFTTNQITDCHYSFVQK